MRIKLPHRTVNLDMELSIEDRIPVIDELLKEEVKFHSETMTIEEYFRYTWDKQNTKICMDIIGYYLTKENRNLDILSNRKLEEMSNGSKRHTTFSGMGYGNQVKHGIIDPEDYDYN